MDQLLSVIVPVYNLEAELPRCLDSILAQTYSNLEILVVDDGSQDNSQQVIEAYASQDSRIKPIFQENAGVTAARLAGIAQAAGSWIGFVDGDDEIEPSMYERLLKNASVHHADISHCGYQMVFPDGRVHYFHNSGTCKLQNSETAVRDLLEGTLVEPGLCNKLYRSKLFLDLPSRMDTSIRINEDFLMNYYLFSAAEYAVFEDWCPYHYIVRRTSASRAKMNAHKIYDPIRVKETILADVSEQLIPDARNAFLSTCIYTYCSLALEKQTLYAQARKHIRKKLSQRRSWFPHLPKKARLLAFLIVNAPVLFHFLYPIYSRFLQKHKYS